MAPGNWAGSDAWLEVMVRSKFQKEGKRCIQLGPPQSAAAPGDHSGVLRPESQSRERHSGPFLIVPFLMGQGICDLGT